MAVSMTNTAFPGDPVPSSDAVVTDEEISSDFDSDEFLRVARDWYRRDRDHSSEWRQEACEDFDFYSGRQWDEESIKILEEQGRPCITFNRIQPIINAVVGLEIQNRQTARFIPRQIGDEKPNELFTEGIRWIRDETNGEDEDSSAFNNTVICGLGATETRIEYEEDPDGKAVIEAVDPRQMVWDKNARKRNLLDARRVWRVKTNIPLSEARAMFPDAEDSELHASWADVSDLGEDTQHDADPETAYQKEYFEQDEEKQRGMVTIVHLQWYELETYYRVQTMIPSEDPMMPPMEERRELMEDEFYTLADRITQIGGTMKHVRLKRRIYWQAFLGDSVLKKEKTLFDNSFSWKFITGIPDINKGTFHGLVRPLKDPQRWANKWLSQALHIINVNAKGGIMAERGAFEDDEEAERTWSDPQMMTFTAPGAITGGRIQPKPQPALPTAIDRLMEFAIQSMRDAVGVNLELMGMRDATQPGVLEAQRKQAGMTILANLFDSIRLYRKEQGRLMLECVQKYLADGRLVRITGEENAQYVPLVRDPDIIKYDVIVDDAPTSANQKEQVWQMILALLPSIGNMLSPQMWLALAKYSPLPSNVLGELQKAFEKQEQSQAESAQKQEQLAQQVNAREDTKVQIDATKAAATAQKDTAQAALTQVKAQKEAATPIMPPFMPGIPRENP